MKILKFIFSVLLCCLILFSINSCKKDHLISEQIVPSQKFTIEMAKKWHSGSVSEKNSDGMSISAASKRIRLEPIWALATENILKDKRQLVAVPLKASKKLPFGKSGFRKLLVYRDKNNVIKERILEVIFKEEDIKSKKPNLYKTATFSGKIILYDTNLLLIGGREYENGKLTALINKVEKGANTVSGFSQICFSEWIEPNDGYYLPGCDCSGYLVMSCIYTYQNDQMMVPTLDPIDEVGGGAGGGAPAMGGDFYGSAGEITSEEAAAYIKERSAQFIAVALNDVDQEFRISPYLSDAEKAVLYDRIYTSYQLDFTGNFYSSVEVSVTNSNFSDDDPFYVWLKQKYRRWIGIDKPLGVQEATELSNELSSWGIVGEKIKAYFQAVTTIYGFIPGYSALHNLLIGDYGSAAANASFDLFGAGVLKYATTGILSAGTKYSIRVSELVPYYPNIASKLKDFAVTEIKFIKRSNTDKVIIIGESMSSRVLPSKSIFDKIFKPGIERFEPSYVNDLEFSRIKVDIKTNFGRDMTLSEVQATALYQENETWIKNKLAQGYNVIDIGPLVPERFKSMFYGMEHRYVYP